MLFLRSVDLPHHAIYLKDDLPDYDTGSIRYMETCEDEKDKETSLEVLSSCTNTDISEEIGVRSTSNSDSECESIEEYSEVEDDLSMNQSEISEDINVSSDDHNENDSISQHSIQQDQNVHPLQEYESDEELVKDEEESSSQNNDFNDIQSDEAKEKLLRLLQWNILWRGKMQ